VFRNVDGITGISLYTDIAHEKKIAGLPQICILTLSLRNLTPPNRQLYCKQKNVDENVITGLIPVSG